MKDSETSGAYETTVGLEIHAELNTKTKLFCNSKNDPDETRPNVNICPVCMGHPGTLPVLNKEAVKKVIQVGLAVGGKIADVTEFDRKHYFYPDIPKGYQISQYKHPLVEGGSLNGIALTRIHLEEDTASSSHTDSADSSLVDFNRAGVPLMELVTEPVIHSAVDAGNFAREFQLLLQYLGVGEANMEKGEMRVEANISVALAAKKGDGAGGDGSASTGKPRGTKVEVKNLNSFKAVEKAIAFETARHIELIEAGEKVVQETRGWDENKGVTFSQRLKEQSHDYRYFPDPDLPKLHLADIPELNPQTLKENLPELPSERRARLKKDSGIKDEDAEMYVRNRELGNYFEAVTKIAGMKNGVVASNYITSDLAGLIKENPERWNWTSSAPNAMPIAAENFAKLIAMIAAGTVSSRGAKNILKIMFDGAPNATATDPEKIAAEHDLIQKNDEGHLGEIISKIISEHTNVVADYKAGKPAALQFLIGQAMKATKGSANPEVLKKVLLEKIS
ncbi:MAG: Asp-tRNA(Asn)/Glu-tRNA(Gln) amidotransferase subunit GatB [Patescibacteria group bacterium]